MEAENGEERPVGHFSFGAEDDDVGVVVDDTVMLVPTSAISRNRLCLHTSKLLKRVRLLKKNVTSKPFCAPRDQICS